MRDIPKVILMLETSRSSGRALLRGIARYSRLHGPWTVYTEPGGLDKELPELKNWGACGIIMRDSEKARRLLDLGIPTIIATHSSSKTPGSCDILADSEAICRMGVEHLLMRGFKHFGYCGFDHIPWSHDRQAGFASRIEKAGFHTYIYSQPDQSDPRDWKHEQAFIAEWLISLPKPAAIMACNDDRALHVIEACKSAGLRVPEEVAVLGVDNDDLVCDLSHPTLSSIAVDFESAGFEAAMLLDKLMAGKNVDQSTIAVNPTHVVTRQSTDILAIDDPEVAEAVRYIRDNSRRMVQVTDVAEHIGLSRRALYERFRKSLGTSVHNEIRRSKIEQIARLLLETSQPISKIALELGYNDVDHIARYFKQDKGMTPKAYRKLYGAKFT